jgi:hypothetical protein
MNQSPTATTSQETSATADKSLKALEILLQRATPAPAKAPVPEPQEPQSFPACSPPDVRIPPQFIVPYRRAVLINQIPVTIGDDIDIPILRLACAKVRSLELWAGFDLKFDQAWNLIRLGIGDLSSTIGLAPSERLTLEFRISQRRLLERTSVDSAEELTSFESTTLDKEVLNVARSSSKTENWHVDGSASFGIGSFKIGAGANVNQSTVQTSNRSIQQITEATTKSSHSLRTLHKIEVRGVTETLIDNRMTRLIKNPYPDRTLSINVFQLIKHFSVETSLAEIRLSLIIPVNALVFDGEFVVAYSDFLRRNLLDESLIDELPLALQGAKPVQSSGAQERATATAKLALRYLFGGPGPESNVFNVLDFVFDGNPVNANDPASSFDAQIAVDFGKAGLDDALRSDMGLIFTVLNVFFAIYREMINTDTLDDNAVTVASALAADVGPKFSAVEDQAKIRDVLDEGDLTEIFRRLSGFLAIVSGMLQPILAAAEDEKKAAKEQEQAVFALDRLIRHLLCNMNYYVQRFLIYLAQQTDNQAIIDFVGQVLARGITDPALLDQANRTFDVERSFVDRQQIIVPSFELIPPDSFGEGQIAPTLIEVDSPCDGIHLEVAEGACTLANVPAEAGNKVELAVENASLRVDP